MTGGSPMTSRKPPYGWLSRCTRCTRCTPSTRARKYQAMMENEVHWYTSSEIIPVTNHSGFMLHRKFSCTQFHTQKRTGWSRHGSQGIGSRHDVQPAFPQGSPRITKGSSGRLQVVLLKEHVCLRSLLQPHLAPRGQVSLTY